MRNCKMILSGRDRGVQFLCERCAVGEVVEVRQNDGRSTRKLRSKQPGVCVSCAGAGKTDYPRCKCKECTGTGVCPECNGEYSRSWNDLPITAQSKVLSRLDHDEDLIGGMEIMSGLYKTYF